MKRSKRDLLTRRLRRQIHKVLKIAAPHVGLLLLLCLFIFVCSHLIVWLERDSDIRQQRVKLEGVQKLYEEIVRESWKLHNAEKLTPAEWNAFWQERLRSLSKQHDGQDMPKSRSDIKSRWTFQSCMLFILTMFCACGCEWVKVTTPAGQIFTVASALIGIPLLFTTAANIGKGIAEALMLICTAAAKIFKPLRRRLSSKKRRKSKAAIGQNNNGALAIANPPADAISISSSIIEAEKPRTWLTLCAYVGLIFTYTAIGGLIYSLACQWSFFTAFYFSFETITTLVLGSIEVTSWLFLAMNVAYILVGISIVTVCIQLASKEITFVFLKFHYFGRSLPKNVLAEHFNDLMNSVSNQMHSYYQRLQAYGHHLAEDQESSAGSLSTTDPAAYNEILALTRAVGQRVLAELQRLLRFGREHNITSVNRQLEEFISIMAEAMIATAVPRQPPMLDLRMLGLLDAFGSADPFGPYRPSDLSLWRWIDDTARSTSRTPRAPLARPTSWILISSSDNRHNIPKRTSLRFADERDREYSNNNRRRNHRVSIRLFIPPPAASIKAIKGPPTDSSGLTERSLMSS